MPVCFFAVSPEFIRAGEKPVNGVGIVELLEREPVLFGQTILLDAQLGHRRLELLPGRLIAFEVLDRDAADHPGDVLDRTA